jgi:hypothetical protein
MNKFFDKIEKVNQDCNAIDWHAKAKDSIKIVYKENRKYYERTDCSRSEPIAIDLPIKKIVMNEFLFDEVRSIPLVSKRIFNFAESIAMKELDIFSEREFYEINSEEPDIDVLKEKVIPVVANILKYQYKLNKMGFSDEINLMLSYEEICKKEVVELAKKLH